MGHLQDMTPEQRLEFQSMQYEAMKKARRGNSFYYLNDEARQKLIDKGYEYYDFPTAKYRSKKYGNFETISIQHAKDGVELLRSGKKHFARIVVNPCHNIKGSQTYSILFKKRIKKH